MGILLALMQSDNDTAISKADDATFIEDAFAHVRLFLVVVKIDHVTSSEVGNHLRGINGQFDPLC